MPSESVIRLLTCDTKHSIPRYAIVDCAATAAFEDDDEILNQLSHADIEKHTLFTGQNVWAINESAPNLVPLDTQPELEKWLLQNGWGKSWAIFFSSEAGAKTLLAHFRQFFEVEAPNGRDTFFKFYHPLVMGDFLPLLTEPEALAFFGPVKRFVIGTEHGEPAVFDRPRGELSEPSAPAKIVFTKRKQLAKQWQTRLLDQHVAAYGQLGFKATADTAANAVTLKDQAGQSVRLQKTNTGVDIFTAEQRRFQYELTSCKHPAAIVDPAGNRIEFDIQERDNKEKRNTIAMLNAIRMPGEQKTWVFDYDEMDHLERIDYPDHTSATISHDSYGNLTEITDRNGHSTRYAYDFNQLLIALEDGNGHSTAFNYQDFNAASTIAFADGTTFNFEYTDTGALENFLAGNTRVARYEVDQETGSWKVDYTDGGQAEFEVRDNKIVRATNAAGTVTLDYDAAGNLIKERFQNRSVTYHRNPTGHLTGISTPFNQKIEYSRNGEQRICAIKDWNGRTINIQYAPNGAAETILYPNGTRLEQQTNAQGLPTQMQLTGKQGTLFYKTFKRDLLNRITHISDAGQKISYIYDKQGRVLAARNADADIADENFTLDANANRLADDNTRYAVNASDRLIRAGGIPFQYDSCGNLTRGACPRGRADFAYTDINRLKSISLQNNRAQYLYDAFGRRVAKKVNGTTTRYFWARSQLLHEAQIQNSDATHTSGVIDYLFFPETPVLLAIRQDEQTRWAAFGHRYETLCLTDRAGRLVWQARYTAFGQAHIETGWKLHQPFRLAGQYCDPESGLHYNLARYYDPGQGRFLSPDPLFIHGGSTNFYTYCNGDPINRIDPCGEAVFGADLIGATVGSAVSTAVESIGQPKATHPKSNGFKPAQAALNGGGASNIGGTVASVEDPPAAKAPPTALAAATLPAMGKAGFLAGAGASTAEQCAQLEMTGNGIDPLDATQQALADAVAGTGSKLPALGAGGFAARKLPELEILYRPELPAERTATLAQKNKALKAAQSPATMKKGRKNSNHADKCTDGDPVNSVTGEVVLDQGDFVLPGRIPLAWNRHYGSQSDYCGLLGPGWQSPADARLELDAGDMVTFYDGRPGGAVFEKLPTDAPVMEACDGAELSATEERYQVKLKSGLAFEFAKTFTHNRSHVIRISDPSGNYLAFDRDRGALTQIRDSSGRRIQVTSSRGRIVSMHLGGKPLVDYRYDGGRLTAAVDAAGGQKRFEYRQGRLVRHMDKNKVSFHYDYDDRGRCIHSWGDNGLYDYRFDHRIYERRVHVTDSLGHQKTYIYDHDRLPVTVVDPTGARTHYKYDDVGRVIQITDALERTTRYTYDAAGNVTEITRPDHNRVCFVYDRRHRPVQMLDANGKLWEQRFDPAGRLIEKISPLDARTGYNYNRYGDLQTITDPEGRTTTFEYDEQGLVSAVIDAAGNPTRYQRDLLGNITAVIDPAGRTARYVYDERSRLIEAVRPSGAGQHFDWDGEDNLLLHTDPNGHQTRFEYGGLNEIIRRINADGTSVAYQYDTEENLTGVTNEKGRTYKFEYDSAGRVAAQTDYWDRTTRYTYDAAGQLIQSIDPLERTIAYDYDAAGRLLNKIFESQDRESFTWDATGNLIGCESPGAMAAYFYDAAGHLVAEQNGGFIIEYQYDKSGRRTGRFTSYGNHVRYRYDPTGALSAIQINDNDPMTIERDKLGRIISEQFSQYLKRSLDYDRDGLLTRQSIDGAGGAIERRYTYDPAGNLTARHDSRKGARRFDHDPMGRITEALDPEHQLQRFGYDPAGDLLEHLPDTGQGMRRARYNQTEYRFDAAGNLAERQNGDELTKYTWDENNRLKTARKADDTRIDMTYDALGRRRIKAINGERTYYHYDGDALLCEQFEDQAPREYVYYPGTFEPLALIDGDGSIYYYHNDPNGLPCELTKYNGDIVWSADYDALGRVEQILVDEVEQPLRMQGQYWDDEIGLCYNRYRYYDPQICSFISQDPLGLAAGENVYAYAPNVWGWVDPLGLCKDTNERGLLSSLKNIFQKKKPTGNPNILSGHGAHNPWDGYVEVPEGTSFTTWTKYGNEIYDDLGNAIETGQEITVSKFGSQIQGAQTYLPGAKVPNYTLYPPEDLIIKGNPTTVGSPNTLKKLIKPNMGNIQWAACQKRMNRFLGVFDKFFNLLS